MDTTHQEIPNFDVALAAANNNPTDKKLAGALLRIARELKEMSQLELGKALGGMPDYAISSRELGEDFIFPSLAVSLAKQLVPNDQVTNFAQALAMPSILSKVTGDWSKIPFNRPTAQEVFSAFQSVYEKTLAAAQADPENKILAGALLRLARDLKGWNKTKLADAVGMSEQDITPRETGKTVTFPPLAVSFAEQLVPENYRKDFALALSMPSILLPTHGAHNSPSPVPEKEKIFAVFKSVYDKALQDAKAHPADNVYKGKLLRIARLLIGQTLPELVEQVGKSKSTISDYEAGRITIPSSFAEEFAKLLPEMYREDFVATFSMPHKVEKEALKKISHRETLEQSQRRALYARHGEMELAHGDYEKARDSEDPISGWYMLEAQLRIERKSFQILADELGIGRTLLKTKYRADTDVAAKLANVLPEPDRERFINKVTSEALEPARQRADRREKSNRGGSRG